MPLGSSAMTFLTGFHVFRKTRIGCLERLSCDEDPTLIPRGRMSVMVGYGQLLSFDTTLNCHLTDCSPLNSRHSYQIEIAWLSALQIMSTSAERTR